MSTRAFPFGTGRQATLNAIVAGYNTVPLIVAATGRNRQTIYSVMRSLKRRNLIIETSEDRGATPATFALNEPNESGKGSA